MKPIRVIVVDDQSIVRHGAREILDAQNDIEVIAEAARTDEAIRLALDVRPDLLLVDFDLLKKGGLQVAKALRETLP